MTPSPTHPPTPWFHHKLHLKRLTTARWLFLQLARTKHVSKVSSPHLQWLAKAFHLICLCPHRSPEEQMKLLWIEEKIKNSKILCTCNREMVTWRLPGGVAQAFQWQLLIPESQSKRKRNKGWMTSSWTFGACFKFPPELEGKEDYAARKMALRLGCTVRNKWSHSLPAVRKAICSLFNNFSVLLYNTSLERKGKYFNMGSMHIRRGSKSLY